MPLTICRRVLLPLPFGTDDAKDFAALDVERDIAKRPKFIRCVMAGKGKQFQQPVGRPPV